MKYEEQVKVKMKNKIVIAIIFFALGLLTMFLYVKAEIKANKDLTKRIIQVSLNNIEANHAIADSCANAYNTVTNCLANPSSCNLQKESKKLDAYEEQKENANQQMKKGNEELKSILKELKH